LLNPSHNQPQPARNAQVSLFWVGKIESRLFIVCGTNMELKRLNGLDSLRALAILLVLMAHYRLFSKEYTFGFLTAK
jgi:hypothetical protein